MPAGYELDRETHANRDARAKISGYCSVLLNSKLRSISYDSVYFTSIVFGKERITLLNSIRQFNSNILKQSNGVVTINYFLGDDSFNIKMNTLILNYVHR